MKRVLVLNPNTTEWMTERVVEQVRGNLGPDVITTGFTAPSGVPVIDSEERFAQAAEQVPGLLANALTQLNDNQWNGNESIAVLLACFGDPGLEAVRGRFPSVPIIGLAESAMAFAVSNEWRFAILTSGPAWIDMLTERASDSGYLSWLLGVYALPIDGKQFAENPDTHRAALQGAADRARSDGAQALILGGVAFAGLGSLLDTDLPIIDGINTAIQRLRLIVDELERSLNTGDGPQLRSLHDVFGAYRGAG